VLSGAALGLDSTFSDSPGLAANPLCCNCLRWIREGLKAVPKGPLVVEITTFPRSEGISACPPRTDLIAFFKASRWCLPAAGSSGTAVHDSGRISGVARVGCSRRVVGHGRPDAVDARGVAACRLVSFGPPVVTTRGFMPVRGWVSHASPLGLDVEAVSAIEVRAKPRVATPGSRRAGSTRSEARPPSCDRQRRHPDTHTHERQPSR
jgi:hypothetical protein